MNPVSKMVDSFANVTNDFSAAPATAAASHAKAALADEFHYFVADIEDLVKQTTALTGDELTRAKANLQARMTSAKESIAHSGQVLSKSMRKSASHANRYVHDQPWLAIGIGAAIGVVLGLSIGRRH